MLPNNENEDPTIIPRPDEQPRILLAVEDSALRGRVRLQLGSRYALEPMAGWVRGRRAGVNLVVGDAAGLAALGERVAGIPVIALVSEKAKEIPAHDGRVFLPLRGTELAERVEIQLELARLRGLSAARERALSEELAEARRRLSFVGAASRALSTAMDVDATLAAVASVAVPTLAQWGTVDMLENGRHVRKAAWHHVSHKTGILERVAGRYSSIEDRRHPVHRVMTSGKTELVPEVPVDFARRLAQTPEHLDLLHELDIAGYICVPLKVQGQTAGVLTLGSDSTWPAFTRADAALAEDLAARAEAAIERSRLFHAGQVELHERRNAELELRRQQEHERLIFDTIDAMVWYKDTENRVLRVNRAAAAWTGLPAEQIEGRRIDQIFDRERAKAFHDHDLAVIAAGRPIRDLELVVMQDGRERWVQRDSIPHRDKSGRVTGVIIFAVDVTEQKLLEDMLRANERAQKEFVANVSHEFRTPVAAIKGFAETLQAGAWRDREDRERFLEIIDNNADRLNDLIEDLLTLSALEEGSKPAVDHVDVRTAALACAERLTEKAREAELSLAVAVPPNVEVACDRRHLWQILENLLDNAIRCNRPLGTVRVRAERRGDVVWVMVEDNGIGIGREHLARVFERFYRVEKGATPGRTGLGLHIVKKLVEAQGGRVWVESELGEGSAFYVELPAFDASRVPRGGPPSRSSHSSSALSPSSGLIPTTLKKSSELDA